MREGRLDPAQAGGLWVLLGPTGIGKTEVAVRLARRRPLEIVNADSRQIYRGLDVGTAKPSPAQRAAAPHHLYDVRPPHQVLSLAEYQKLACAAIDDVLARKRRPLLVGGTPLYIRAIVHNLRIPAVPPDPALRAELEARLAARGPEPLFRELERRDPATAAVTDPRNGRRIVRALEVFLKTGQSKVRLEGERPPRWPVRIAGLTCPRPALHARVKARIDAMMQAGLLEETRGLLAQGADPALPALTALGYPRMIQHLAGELSLTDAVAKIQYDTHRYIRHQYTWFRRWPDIKWIPRAGAPASALADCLLQHWT